MHIYWKYSQGCYSFSPRVKPYLTLLTCSVLNNGSKFLKQEQISWPTWRLFIFFVLGLWFFNKDRKIEDELCQSYCLVRQTCHLMETLGLSVWSSQKIHTLFFHSFIPPNIFIGHLTLVARVLVPQVWRDKLHSNNTRQAVAVHFSD